MGHRLCGIEMIMLRVACSVFVLFRCRYLNSAAHLVQQYCTAVVVAIVVVAIVVVAIVVIATVVATVVQ